MGIAQLVDTVLDRTVVGGYPHWGYAVRKRLPSWPADPPGDALAGKSVLVTGASSGLGAAAAAAFAGLGATVHLVVRSVERGERVAVGVAGSRVWRCDVSDLDDVTRFVESFDAGVDVVVHNAGQLPDRRTESAQGHELTLATHVLGPLRMTELLRPALRSSTDARVIWVSSGGMYAQPLPVSDPEYAEGEYKGASAYARTKRIQVALVSLLARRWADDGIGVHAMHPGWADTPGVSGSLPGFHRLTSKILRSADEGADTMVWLAATTPRPPSGLFWHDRRPRDTHLLPWTRHDESARESMLTWCAKAAGVDL